MWAPTALVTFPLSLYIPPGCVCVCVTSRLLGVIPTLNCLAVVDYTMRECLAGRLYSAAQLISV